MRNQRSFHRAAALLRQGMALSVAVALVCSLALSSAALEVDVLNETTGLVESVDLDEDAAQPEEDAPAASDADEEPEETPTEETGEAPADADEETPKTDAEETPTEDNEEKSEDTSKADDTDDAAPDDDFLFVDDSTDETDDAFSVDYYADSTATQETGVYYYYNGKSADSNTDYSYEEANMLNDTVRHGFYNSDNTLTHVTGTDAATTMETFITNHPGATIHMVTGYILGSGKIETWNCANITLQRAQNYRAIEIEGGILTLNGTLKLEQSGYEDGVGASIRVVSGGTLDLYDGVTIEGLRCTSGRSGGIIYMERGTVNMYGGTLSNSALSGNYARGGAVYLNEASSIFNMYGGVIKDASSQDGGGGVYVAHGTFNMSGGTIEKNESNNGGGVYVAEGAKFEMTGGTITGNTSSASGGGVYVYNGTVEMSRGTIEKNTAQWGGGVYVNGSTSKFTLSGGSISENSGSQTGGGVSVLSGTFEICGGEVSGNKCTVVDKDGGYIGGGIYVRDATLTMSAGKISENVANGCGGGVFIYNSTFKMSGGEISGNQSTSTTNTWGGGVAMADRSNGSSTDGKSDSDFLSVFEMTGGSITRNSAYSTSAVSVMGGTFYIQGGTIADNEWSSSNHNEVSVNEYGRIKISGGSVKNINGWNGITNDKWLVSFGETAQGVIQYPVQVGYSEGQPVDRTAIHIKLDDEDITSSPLGGYTFTDVCTDSEGKIYLWLPKLGDGKKYTVTYGDTPAAVTYQAKIQRKTDGGYQDIGMSVAYGTELWAVLEAQEPSTQSYSLYSEDDLTTTSEVASDKMYAWSYADSRTSDSWTTITDADKQYYTPTTEQAGKWVRVTMKRRTTDTQEYTSEPVLIGEPRLSVTVPLSITVTIAPDTGEGIVQGDGDYIALYAADNNCSVWNDSDVAVTLNSVTFTWNDEAQKYFTNWNANKPTIKLNNTESTTDADEKTLTWTPGTQIDSGGSADLQWSFSLNGNAISQELQANTKASIGTITYTVSFADTASGGDSTTTTRAPGTPVVF